MIYVDVVCEAEHLPRLKLLQTHMRSLNVELQIHETVPETYSDRLLIVPRPRNSKLASLEVAEHCERIALFLDEQTEPIEADMQVTLHSWPARSSDRHVETLARHLLSNRRTLSEEDIRDSGADKAQTQRQDSSTAPSAALTSKRAERRKNVTILTLLGVGVVALVSLLENEPTQPDVQTAEDVEEHSAEPLPTATVVKEADEAEPALPQQRSPEIVVLDETGARISQETGPRLCSPQDQQEGLASEPCRLILF